MVDSRIKMIEHKCSLCDKTVLVPDQFSIFLIHLHIIQIAPNSLGDIYLGIEEWERDMKLITRLADLSSQVFDLDHIFFVFDDAKLCIACGLQQLRELKEMGSEITNLRE